MKSRRDEIKFSRANPYVRAVDILYFHSPSGLLKQQE